MIVFPLCRAALAMLVSGAIMLAPPVLGSENPAARPAEDPQTEVLLWQRRRVDLPVTQDVPQLRLRADGTLTAGDPHGPGCDVQRKLSAPQLTRLVAELVQDESIFDRRGAAVRHDIRRAKLERGIDPKTPIYSRTTLRVRANGREYTVECDDLAEFADSSPAASKLAAIEQRIQQLLIVTYAGGEAAIIEAVGLANERLRREFPAAPLLSPGDLQAALQQHNGLAWLEFERRGVAADKNSFSFVSARIERRGSDRPEVLVRAHLKEAIAPVVEEARGEKREPMQVEPPPVAEDASVKYDFPIVYVRAPRMADRDKDSQRNFWPNIDPVRAPPGSELMILHPDGRQQVLVPVEPHEAIVDPYVSFDGAWVFFAKYHDATRPMRGSDLYKVHVATGKVVRLTNQEESPNQTDDGPRAYKMPPVRNLGPCPVPGGKVAFVSDRNRFKAVGGRLALQLFVMDDDGTNVEAIGHLNLGDALHPTILKDGRLMFSSRETQGLRTESGYTNAWGIWAIHPDGTNWEPLVSAFNPNPFHFQTQLSDSSIVVEFYYQGTTTQGFGTFFRFPVRPPDNDAAFAPADPRHPWNNTLGLVGKLPFSPYGIHRLTRFATFSDRAPNLGWGNVTHPSGAPDNHLLLVWGGTIGVNKSLGGTPPGYPSFDSGIYLLKSGRPIDQPHQMRRILNDPKFHEMWPRALVPYARIYGAAEPPRLVTDPLPKEQARHLPAGTPFALVGTSSLYKRESYPLGVVPEGKVTAEFNGSPRPYRNTPDPFRQLGGVFSGNAPNWGTQGAEAGLYNNDEVHAIRIVVTEPAMPRHPYDHTRFLSHASRSSERLRILGEFPVRKFDGQRQPVDPDGHPDTSFLARMPADVAWTFQTLDKHGMVLNMAQTWHQLRPGESRTNCGGCHAHSQQPTPFELTAAARADYPLWDLTAKTPLLTSKRLDETGKKWDAEDASGVRFVQGAHSVEYHRHVKPILDRSCVACHTQAWKQPAGGLVLDDDALIANRGVPGTYYRLAMESGYGHGQTVEYGPMPLGGQYVRNQASRYIRKLQARRSLLIWKVFGERLDGWSNEDHPSETAPGSGILLVGDEQIDSSDPRYKEAAQLADIDYAGSIMPPPSALDGTFPGPDGQPIKVPPLSDEDRLTLVRWIDLGCPIDLDYDAGEPDRYNTGWMLDEGRPTLVLADPPPGASTRPLAQILVGMHDYGSGLDLDSLRIVADFPVDGEAPGTNLAGKARALSGGRWQLQLRTPIAELPRGTLVVSVQDRQGNLARIERTFSLHAPAQ